MYKIPATHNKLILALKYKRSDSGASPDEAVSWGKIKREAKPVKIFSEATLVFPLLVAQTFAKNFPRTAATTTNAAQTTK